jgi:site-specific DNA-methyltransferase (adenine-specific)
LACQGKDGGEDFGGFGKVLRPSFYNQTTEDRDNFIQFMTDVMTECKRVLKSGGHAVVWALPRTSHWTTMAIENAGFEIRDVIHHIFNTGFPKSFNIGKGIDKKLGNEREVIGIDIQGKKSEGVMAGHHGWAEGEVEITKGSSEWEGFGTALKPACEHWILARKPLSEKTIVEQVLNNGCGGINIDGCRIPTSEAIKVSGDLKQLQKWKEQDGRTEKDKDLIINKPYEHNMGRFPANVIVQDDSLNDGTISKSPKGNVNRKQREGNVFTGETSGFKSEDNHTSGLGDIGSKSRYFDIDLWAERNGILQ